MIDSPRSVDWLFERVVFHDCAGEQAYSRANPKRHPDFPKALKKRFSDFDLKCWLQRGNQRDNSIRQLLAAYGGLTFSQQRGISYSASKGIL